jgi:hypothetical protein
VEAGGTPSSGLGTELDRIERAVDAGDTDLRRLGFWRVVGLVKLDDDLVKRYADQVGRIDAKTFRARIRLRAPVWTGVVLQVLGLAVGAAAVILAVRKANATAGQPPGVELFSGLALLVAAGAWAAGVHSLAHYLVGRLVGIGFTDFFFALPPPPLPGLKTDYATYLRASPVARAWMHASGAIATKLAPFVALVFASAADAPSWATWAVVVFGVFQLATDLLFSTKASDWKKVRRELAVAKARRRRTT